MPRPTRWPEEAERGGSSKAGASPAPCPAGRPTLSCGHGSSGKHKAEFPGWWGRRKGWQVGCAPRVLPDPRTCESFRPPLPFGHFKLSKQNSSVTTYTSRARHNKFLVPLLLELCKLNQLITEPHHQSTQNGSEGLILVCLWTSRTLL